jgi:hypothetical protein
LAAAALILLIAVLVVWVRSRHVQTDWRFAAFTGTPEKASGYYVGTFISNGTISFEMESNLRIFEPGVDCEEQSVEAWGFWGLFPDADDGVLGFGYETFTSGSGNGPPASIG